MASTTERIEIRGLLAVEASLRRYQRGIRKAANKSAYAAAKLVAMDARTRFPYDRKTAMGFVPSVRGPTARVKQRLGKTTGLRGDFGSLQMRKALLPALYAKQGEALALYEADFELLRKGSGL